MNATFKTILLAMLALAALAMAQGCTVYKTAVDERTIGQIYDDESITFEIERKFLADEVVKYLDFTSHSYLGHVYIIGEYENERQVTRAKMIARGVYGVNTVTTYLLPKRDEDLCGTMDEVEIGARVDKDLLADPDVYGTNVDTAVVQCNLILLGRVGSKAEIARAEEIARAVPGVRSVKNFLQVYPAR